MTQSSTLYIGMDVHKDSIAVAYITQDHHAEVVPSSPSARASAISTNSSGNGSPKAHIWSLSMKQGRVGIGSTAISLKKGHVCWVVAPSVDPHQTRGSGQNQPSRCHQTGPAAAFWGPAPLSTSLRLRTEPFATCAVPVKMPTASLKAAKFRLKAFLLRQDIRYTGRATWGPAHLRWLSEVVCPTPAQQIVFQEYVRAVTEAHRTAYTSGTSSPTPR